MAALSILDASDSGFTHQTGFGVAPASQAVDPTFTIVSTPAHGAPREPQAAPGETMVSIFGAVTTQLEGDSGTTPFLFTISRTGDLSDSTTVKWAVTGKGSTGAANAADFGGKLPGGTVTFAPGESSVNIALQATGDLEVESNDSFVVTLSAPSGTAKLSTATATGTIVNDDTSLAITATTADSSKPEGDSGTTPFKFTVTRTGDLSGITTVKYNISGGVNGDDFAPGTPLESTVTFSPGETTQTITLDAIGDTVVETDEVIVVTLFEATDATISKAIANGKITNDDSTKLSVDVLDAIKAEGDSGTTSFTFTVTRTGDLSDTTTVRYSTTTSATLNSDDFANGIPSGLLTFAPGETTQTITVGIKGDTTVEADEQLIIKLTDASGSAKIATAQATGKILNDDSTLSLSIKSPAIAEGDSGTKPFTFTVTRDGDASGESTVIYTVLGIGDNAANSADFGGAFPSGKLIFTAGEKTKTIDIMVAGDTTFEPDEIFQVVLTNPTNAMLITDNATATILSDDAKVSISGPTAIKEGDTADKNSYTFTVTREGGTVNALKFDYEVLGIGSSPTDASDFTGKLTGTVSIAAGATTATITVTPAGDMVGEPDETFSIVLSNPSGGNVVLTNAVALATLVDDDRPTTGSAIVLTSTSGMSRLIGTKGADAFVGSRDLDTVIQNGIVFGAATLERNADGSVIMTSDNGVDQMIGIDRIRVDDGVVLLDLGNNGGAVLRLYQAAFGRLADEAGLRVQTDFANRTSTIELARSLMSSPEFAARYGANSSNETFVAALYQNVLHRTPDAPGLAAQIAFLTSGNDRAVLLRNFAESQENLIQTAALTQVGVFSPLPDPLLL